MSSGCAVDAAAPATSNDFQMKNPIAIAHVFKYYFFGDAVTFAAVVVAMMNENCNIEKI